MVGAAKQAERAAAKVCRHCLPFYTVCLSQLKRRRGLRMCLPSTKRRGRCVVLFACLNYYLLPVSTTFALASQLTLETALSLATVRPQLLFALNYCLPSG